MRASEMLHAQSILSGLRERVDSLTARVVHQDVQGEGVQQSLLLTPVSDSLAAVRCWPEAGWPDQLSEKDRR